MTAGTVGGDIKDHSFGTDASSFSAAPEVMNVFVTDELQLK